MIDEILAPEHLFKYLSEWKAKFDAKKNLLNARIYNVINGVYKNNLENNVYSKSGIKFMIKTLYSSIKETMSFIKDLKFDESTNGINIIYNENLFNLAVAYELLLKPKTLEYTPQFYTDIMNNPGIYLNRYLGIDKFFPKYSKMTSKPIDSADRIISIKDFLTLLYLTNCSINNFVTKWIKVNRLDMVMDDKTSNSKKIDYMYQLFDGLKSNILMYCDMSKVEYKFAYGDNGEDCFILLNFTRKKGEEL